MNECKSNSQHTSLILENFVDLGFIQHKKCTKTRLSGFVKTWLKKFQVHLNYLTSKWNGKQLKVTSWS